ncbi:TPR-like protein [Suillus clintonianus]|uniref:TPR-like protein n=1 Tax=Suillus clintonianus TaxID=1904413 RepID=UPI001B8766BF|nr:TPR-like protein [Suillus clintonianus]KAG2139214.1 TPR-like protein [Suillus clintonianus]
MADWVEKCRAALQRCPPGHCDRSTTLNDLAASLADRFKQRGILSDLDEAIELHQAALLLRPPGHSLRSSSLNNLANSLHDRFKQRGAPSDLDEAIELYRAALLLRPSGHSLRSDSLNNLANSLHDRFEQRGVPSDLDEAIELYRAALLLRPPGHSLRSDSLNNLAISLHDRFEQRGVPSDLDEAIELHRAALLLCPPGHSLRSTSLNNLAISLQDRFEQRGVPSDLDEAIELHRAALLLCPPGHSLRSDSLNNLAISLKDRFEQRGVPSDLDEAIELHRAALLLCPPGHSDRSDSLNNLANSLHDRFEQRGVLSDLDEAIELHQAALLLRAPGHSDRSMSLNNLAISLKDRFEQRGVPSDLDEAIELHRAALLLCPPGHSLRSSSLGNLAISLADRFKQRGVPSDLDEAIELHQAALLLRPPRLQDRFEQRGVPSDLDEAIELHRAALLLRPPGHSLRSSSLNNLAISLQDRFEQRGVPSDLDEAIELYRAALLLRPPGHSDRSLSLNDLAISLHDRFEQRGVPSDLDEAIELHQAALLLRPPGHSDRSMSLNNLAINLKDRFKQRGVPSDLDEAIELYRAALLLRPPGHSLRSDSLKNLALGLHNRFKQWGTQFDLDEAFRLYVQLSYLSHAVSRTDLTAAKSWATFAEEMNHDSALLAYQTALKFLDHHATLLSSSPRHFDVVKMATASLAMDAFSCSVRHGALTTAVEMVEQGRAVFWTQLARLRPPLDELSLSGDTGAALEKEFKQLSFGLRSAFDQSNNEQPPRIRQLTMQWNDVVSRIRMQPDFSRFLLPPLFSDLRKAAEEGPVIIVNASRYGCDALIVSSSHDPVHVPLDITQNKVSELSSEFQSVAEQFGCSNNQLQLVGILRKLWHHVVDPVVQALRISNVHPGSRIWWCPTAEFTLLPLHAAGPYERGRDNLSQIYISSYTPTLATLVRARKRVSQYASTQYFVAIGQANPDRGKELRHVAPELDAISQCLVPIVSSFTSLRDSHATVQGALDALNQNQWLHLACHGMPDRTQPFDSSFAMRDGPLMIKDIIRSNWQNPEFAFLSACHTTVGDEKSPDELIHLAAAIQFSGFRSVIGSMWSVDDEVALQVVSLFYRKMVDGSGRLDCTRAAVALHKAVKSLRKKIPLEQQIVFVHIGV